MIVDVPQPQDFQAAGMGFLNLAFGFAGELINELDEASEWDEEVFISRKRFWQAAQGKLATALALGQQGIELLLKAKIAEVSPFLLLDVKWRDRKIETTSYVDLRTVDAQDLVRLYDISQASPLPKAFVQRVDDLRKLRNSIFHSVNRRLSFAPRDIMLMHLEAVHHLVGAGRWIEMRRKAYQLSHTNVAFPSYVDAHHAQLSADVVNLICHLAPAELRTYLGLNVRQRRYICYDCVMHCNEVHRQLACPYAVLRPNNKTSTTLYCLVCDKTAEVERRPCTDESCGGDVIHGDNVCLSCQLDQRT
jgi:hypothetical protein